MTEGLQRVVAYAKADALAKAVIAASKNWPAQEKRLYLFLRERALRLPGLVMAGVLSESRAGHASLHGEAAVRLLSEALAAACELEYVSGVVQGASGGVKKVHDAAVEARETIQDHLDAMLL